MATRTFGAWNLLLAHGDGPQGPALQPSRLLVGVRPVSQAARNSVCPVQPTGIACGVLDG